MVRVKTGDMEALGELFERYKQPLYGFLFRLLHDAACAEDVTLDVFLRVFDRRHTYKTGFKFSTWLYTIAHHMATDSMRRQGRFEMPISYDDDTLPDGGDLPEDTFQREELAQTVRAAVTALPEDQRLVILLREFQGFSYKEIADVLGSTEETIRVRAYRARQALRKALAPVCEENFAAPVTFSS